jgi:hypothetical protein
MLRLSLLDSQLNVIKPSQRIHLAYRLGTYFARELYLLAHAQKAATSVLPNRSMTITQRFNLAKTVIANLSRVRLLGSATLAQKDLSPHELFQAMIERPDALDADSCSRLQDFMRNAPVGFVMHRCATAVLNIGNNLNRTNSSNSSNQ